MSDVHENEKGLIEYIRGVWPQSMFQRRFLRALAVTCITTCVWMSGREFVSSKTTQHSINMIDIQRRGLLVSDASISPSATEVSVVPSSFALTEMELAEELASLSKLPWTKEMLETSKPIFEAEIQLDGETKKLFLQWNSEFVSTDAHLHPSSCNFGAVAVVRTKKGNWIRLPLYPSGIEEYSEEQEILRTLYMRDLLDEDHALEQSISGVVSQIPFTLPQQVSWSGMYITLKRIVHEDSIDVCTNKC